MRRVLLAGFIIMSFVLAGCGSSDQPFTLDKYERVYIGQDKEDTIRLMGSRGTPNATSSAPSLGITFESIMWQNPDGSNMQVMFQNGKVHTKAQAGLR